MNILLISGYDAASHKRWRQGLERALPEINFTHIALPARYFSWRIRGNSLSLASLYRDELSASYDALVATSMVDLSSLRGMLPSIATVPTLLYFHENQFEYPLSTRQTHSLEPQIVTLYSALCADQLAFNSDFNRVSFLDGVDKLLRKMPDLVPQGIVAQLAEKSQVVPVPLESEVYAARVEAQSPCRPEFVWNHRWEYDKNPDLLLAALEVLKSHFDGALPFTLHVVGERFRRQPEAFHAIHELLTECNALGQWGYIDSLASYRSLLQRCQVVVSTADHDFQGLAVLEAVAAGCIPAVPRRQVYPEFFGLSSCYNVSGNLSHDAQSLASHLIQLLQQYSLQGVWPQAPDVSGLCWEVMSGSYRQLLTRLATHPR
ncbi:tRNA-queuosine alpha-mannosyltransferase domain-containing protein [Gilvimarinus chinensis]|uniref:tRNA-queuosine alpha-mannosyltransferase domain-containing protein n=1 Tax=Gilvimarinus chinensis TaxID=396005 RepID=UPI0003646DBE|nr:DUF3524 domain-containing protein [Gilvimarinus chinensis]